MSNDGEVAVIEGSAGYIEVLEAETGRRKSIAVQGKAVRTTIYRGSNNHFVALHMLSPSAIQIAVHCFNEIASPEGWVDIIDGRVSYGGRLDVWRFAPKFYVMLWTHAVLNCDLIALRPEQGNVTPVPIPWFDDSYDKGYVALSRAFDVPNSDVIYVEMGRADPVLIKQDGSFVQKLPLAGRHGAASPEFFKRDREALVMNYDTLVKISTVDWTLQKSVLVQPGAEKKIGLRLVPMRQFAGSPRLSLDECQCVVPRPFSGDALILDAESFEVIRTVEIGDDPMEACFLRGSKLLVRFWKSGLHKIVNV